MSLLVSWALYALIATSFLIALFAWAVRTGQFTDQDRARYLPLASAAEEREHRQNTEQGG